MHDARPIPPAPGAFAIARLRARAPSLPGRSGASRRLAERLGALCRRVVGWLAGRAGDRRHVSSLSEHHLRDIGLTRAQMHDLFDRRRDGRF